ncbi:MAG TPA: hypothetical protein VMU94_20260 [Streptosporangiaceae bacterium]|nr:hypothetical protein [Streptosporangiaceae bacterium]
MMAVAASLVVVVLLGRGSPGLDRAPGTGGIIGHVMRESGR